MSVTSRMIKTSHADISVSETSGSRFAVLLIHGNSAAKQVFDQQMESDLGDDFHLIAVDLPGHGESSDAFDPARTYTMPGYAEAMVEVLSEMGVDRAAIFGWSLGGHVAMEMMPRFPGVAGVMITGTPPVSPTPDGIQAGFKPIPQIGLAGKPDFTDEEAEMFGLAICGRHLTDDIRKVIRRTDGRAREVMFANLFAGQIADQRELAVKASVPFAVVNGADDPLLNLDYVQSLPYRNLWEKHCFVLRGAGHAPFLDQPEAFNAIFRRFVENAERMKSRTGKRRASASAA